MAWPNRVIAAMLQARDAATATTATSTEDVDLFPYSGLQQAGFFILFFFPSVALLVVALRLWSRLSNKQFGWDDALISAAMVCFSHLAIQNQANSPLPTDCFFTQKVPLRRGDRGIVHGHEDGILGRPQ